MCTRTIDQVMACLRKNQIFLHIGQVQYTGDFGHRTPCRQCMRTLSNADSNLHFESTGKISHTCMGCWIFPLFGNADMWLSDLAVACWHSGSGTWWWTRLRGCMSIRCPLCRQRSCLSCIGTNSTATSSCEPFCSTSRTNCSCMGSWSSPLYRILSTYGNRCPVPMWSLLCFRLSGLTSTSPSV